MKHYFSEHPRAACWSAKNNTRPENVTLNSHEKFWFDCPDCLHQFQSSPHSLQRVWCGYCHKKKLCDNEDCKKCHKNSFASSDKSKFWSSKNEISPRKVFKYSTCRKYWFTCGDCQHEFDSTLGHVGEDNWCPYCANKKLCKNIDCQVCFNKSFASEDKAKHWSCKNLLNPRDVFKSSRKTYIFDCDNCNISFEKTLEHITRSKTWCTNCYNKTETKLYKYLKDSFEVIKNVKYAWCKNDKTSRKLEYDFVIPTFNLIIELDGRQHFTQISNWRCPKEQLLSDVYKTKCANQNGYKVIRILQEEVFDNDYNWLDTNLKPHIIAQEDNMFIAVDEKYSSIYEQHIDLLRR